MTTNIYCHFDVHLIVGIGGYARNFLVCEKDICSNKPVGEVTEVKKVSVACPFIVGKLHCAGASWLT
jgi:hypothetical protein